MWRFVVGLLAVMAAAFGRKAIASAVSVATLWGFHALTKLFPDSARRLAETITRTYYTPPDEWAAFLSEYMQRLTGSTITIDDIKREGLGQGSRSMMEAIGDKFLKPMLSLIMPTRDEIKTNPMGGANRFMSTNLQFQMSAWLLHVLGDIQSFGMFKSLKDLPNAISWSYGIGWLSWLVMGPPFRKGIADPMERYFAKMYEPELLTVTQAVDAVRHGRWDYDRYVDELRERGISPEKASILYELAQKDLSDSVMQKLYRLGWMDKQDIKEEFVRRGFEPARAELMAQLLIDDRKVSIIEDMVHQAEELYKDEKLDEGEVRRYFEAAGWKPDEIDLKINELKMEKAKRRYLTPAQVTQIWKQGKMTEYKCMDYLLKLGYTQEDAQLYMDLRREE